MTRKNYDAERRSTALDLRRALSLMCHEFGWPLQEHLPSRVMNPIAEQHRLKAGYNQPANQWIATLAKYGLITRDDHSHRAREYSVWRIYEAQEATPLLNVDELRTHIIAALNDKSYVQTLNEKIANKFKGLSGVIPMPESDGKGVDDAGSKDDAGDGDHAGGEGAPSNGAAGDALAVVMEHFERYVKTRSAEQVAALEAHLEASRSALEAARSERDNAELAVRSAEREVYRLEVQIATFRTHADAVTDVRRLMDGD